MNFSQSLVQLYSIKSLHLSSDSNLPYPFPVNLADSVEKGSLHLSGAFLRVIFQTHDRHNGPFGVRMGRKRNLPRYRRTRLPADRPSLQVVQRRCLQAVMRFFSLLCVFRSHVYFFFNPFSGRAVYVCAWTRVSRTDAPLFYRGGRKRVEKMIYNFTNWSSSIAYLSKDNPLCFRKRVIPFSTFIARSG